MSEDDALEFLRKQASDAPLEPDSWRQIGIATARGDDLIGDIGVHLSADQYTAEFGLSVHPDRNGLGLGTEAAEALISLLFRYTFIDRVIAVTDARNTACIRLLEKSGMRHTSTRTAEYKGEQCTEFVFNRSRGEGVFMSADAAFRFRDAIAGDEAAIGSVVNSVLEEYGLKADPQRTDIDLRDVQASYSKRGGAFLVVVTESNQIVGCGGLYPLERGDCEIRKMYLLPQARGRGVGGALVDQLLELARTKRFTRVIVETASVLRDAIALYQRRGFLPFDHPHLANRCDQAYALHLASTEVPGCPGRG